jgi:hypothetical protein
MKTILTFLALVILCQSQAQQIIQPGDPILRGDLIRPSHHLNKAFSADSAGNITAEWVNDEVITIDSAAGHIIFARSRQVPIGYYFTDTSITDLSLKPISMHEMHYHQNVGYGMDFGPTNATVHTNRRGTLSDKSYPMKSGYFEDNMIEYVFGYLDLKKGVMYTLDNFNKDTPSPSDPVKIEYVFDDIWILPAGIRLNCRVLHFIHGSASGYVWIDKETHEQVKEVENAKWGTFSATRM